MVDWNCGIPASWLKEDWQQVLNLVQMFITYEGHFSIAHLYQMRLLTHIIGDDTLNLPFYLYNSLIKMSKRYQQRPLSFPQYVYHHGLIRILVQFQLNKIRKSWDEFLIAGGFKGMSSKKHIGHPSFRKRANLQVEEQRDEPYSHSQNHEIQPPSPSHHQHELEQENIVQQSSSSRRLAQRSTRKVGLPSPEPLPIVKPFSKTYTRKKKKPFSSSKKVRSAQPKVLEQSSAMEARVLTRSLAKEKEKLIESPTVEPRPPSPEIHVTEFEVELLKEVEIDVPITVVQKKGKLILPASSSSSSHHFASTHHGEATSSRQPVDKKGKNIPIFYARTPHTHPKNKLQLNSKLKYLVINVNEPSPTKEKKKTISRNKVNLKRKEKARVKETDGLALLSTTMNMLK